jgi:hypothetical protein
MGGVVGVVQALAAVDGRAVGGVGGLGGMAGESRGHERFVFCDMAHLHLFPSCAFMFFPFSPLRFGAGIRVDLESPKPS